jgi:Holliday junction resolvase RusA-like endonuclease
MHDAYWLAFAWAQANAWTMTDKQTHVLVRYWAWMPDRRRRDTSNLAKVLLDSCIGVLWEDDQFVLPQAMGVAVDRAHPRVEMELKPCPTALL